MNTKTARLIALLAAAPALTACEDAAEPAPTLSVTAPEASPIFLPRRVSLPRLQPPLDPTEFTIAPPAAPPAPALTGHPALRDATPRRPAGQGMGAIGGAERTPLPKADWRPELPPRPSDAEASDGQASAARAFLPRPFPGAALPPLAIQPPAGPAAAPIGVPEAQPPQRTDLSGFEPLPNRAPSIDRVAVKAADFSTGCQTRLVVKALDPDRDRLDVTWHVDGEPQAATGDQLALSHDATRRAAQVKVLVTDPSGANTTTQITVPLAPCALPPGAVASADGQRAYLAVDAAQPLETHRYAAAKLGGHLLQIDSTDELAEVQALMPAGPRLMGLTCAQGDGCATVRGDSLALDAWCEGEPDVKAPAAATFNASTGGCWAPVDAQKPLPAIYEFHLPDGALALTPGAGSVMPELGFGEASRHALVVDQPSRVTVTLKAADGGCVDAPPALLSLSFAGDLVDSAEAAHPDACATLVADLPAGTYDVGVQGLPGKDVFAHTLQATLRPAE